LRTISAISLVADISFGGFQDSEDGGLVSSINSLSGQNGNQQVVEEVEVSEEDGERSVNSFHVGVSLVTSNGVISASQNVGLSKELDEVEFQSGQKGSIGGVNKAGGSDGTIEESQQRRSNNVDDGFVDDDSQQLFVGQEQENGVLIAERRSRAFGSAIADLSSLGVEDDQDSVKISIEDSDFTSSLDDFVIEVGEDWSGDGHRIVGINHSGSSVGKDSSVGTVQSENITEEFNQTLGELGSGSGVGEVVNWSRNSVEEGSEDGVSNNVEDGVVDDGVHECGVTNTESGGVKVANGGRSRGDLSRASCSKDSEEKEK